MISKEKRQIEDGCTKNGADNHSEEWRANKWTLKSNHSEQGDNLRLLTSTPDNNCFSQEYHKIVVSSVFKALGDEGIAISFKPQSVTLKRQ